LRRIGKLNLHSSSIDLTPEQPASVNINPVMGDPVLNDPTQPLSFDNLTQIDLTEAVFKGVIPNGLRFSNCTKLAI